MYTQVRPSGEILRIMWLCCGLKLASPDIHNARFSFFLPWRNNPSGPRPPLYRGFMITLKTLQSVELLWTSGQPDAETSTWHTTLTRDRHPSPDGIRTHNPSKRAAADPRLRPRGDWDRPHLTIFTTNKRNNWYILLHCHATNAYKGSRRRPIAPLIPDLDVLEKRKISCLYRDRPAPSLVSILTTLPPYQIDRLYCDMKLTGFGKAIAGVFCAQTCQQWGGRGKLAQPHS
jgi:hypothetical protein